MKFTVATKPFSESLNLGIVPGNISRFYRKSCMVQLTATATDLVVNIETFKICTELRLKGHGDEAGPAVIFVDSGTLRSLVSTLDTTTIDLEYKDNSLVIHSGRSSFNIAEMSEGDGSELERPKDTSLVDAVSINPEQWKFIKEHQMYAIAMSFINPVYRNVWMGEGGESLVGDYDNSLFTRSHNSSLGVTCLLSDTVINLINSLPANARLFRTGKSFVVTFETDSFTYATQFTPDYEDDEGVGSYNSDIIQSQLKIREDNQVTADNKSINKFLSQADLLSESAEDTVTVSVHPDVLTLSNESLKSDITVTGPVSMAYTLEFRIAMLKMVMNHLDDDTITLSPACVDDEPVGIVFATKNMSAVLAAVD